MSDALTDEAAAARVRELEAICAAKDALHADLLKLLDEADSRASRAEAALAAATRLPDEGEMRGLVERATKPVEKWHPSDPEFGAYYVDPPTLQLDMARFLTALWAERRRLMEALEQIVTEGTVTTTERIGDSYDLARGWREFTEVHPLAELARAALKGGDHDQG